MNYEERDAAITKALGIGPGETLHLDLEPPEADDELERRLEREARTVQLGTIGDPDKATDCARVEVSYQLSGQPERAGYWIVHVDTGLDPDEEDRDDDLEHHPATLAREAVVDHVDADRYDRYSVDDVSAH
jgi:hypothetical protein